MADEVQATIDKITVDPARLHVVDIKTVRPNTWNPKDKDTKEYRQVFESIKQNGLMGFIPVRKNPLGESEWEIIDGEQRYTSCVELGYTKILIYDEGEVDDKRARELTIWWQAQVPFNELSLAKMVTNMIEQYGDINTYFSAKQIAEMQELAKFNFDQYQKAPDMPPPPTADLLKNFMVQMKESAYNTLQDAIDRAKKHQGNEEMNDAEALEFISQHFLDNTSPTKNDEQGEETSEEPQE